jgi:hypothetical protein
MLAGLGQTESRVQTDLCMGKKTPQSSMFREQTNPSPRSQPQTKNMELVLARRDYGPYPVPPPHVARERCDQLCQPSVTGPSWTVASLLVQ